MAMRMIVRRLVNPQGYALSRPGMRRALSGQMFQDEEKGRENAYIKKMEQEQLEKHIQKGLSLEEAKAALAAESTAPPSTTAPLKTETGPKTSTDKEQNYAVIAGLIGGVALAFWYFSSPSSSKKEEKE